MPNQTIFKCPECSTIVPEDHHVINMALAVNRSDFASTDETFNGSVCSAVCATKTFNRLLNDAVGARR